MIKNYIYRLKLNPRMSYPSCKSATYLRLISNQDRVGKPKKKQDVATKA